MLPPEGFQGVCRFEVCYAGYSTFGAQGQSGKSRHCAALRLLQYRAHEV